MKHTTGRRYAGTAFMLALALSLVLTGCVGPSANQPAANAPAPINEGDTPAASTANSNTAADAANSNNSAANNDAAAAWLFNIQTQDLDGNAVSGDVFKANKLTVLNIWATWCGPCVRELPELQDVSDYYADKGVQVVGVLQDGISTSNTLDESAIAAAKTLLQGAPASYTMILPERTIQDNLIDQMQYFPTTFLIASDGTIVNVIVGSNDATAWKAHIDQALETLA